MVKMQDKDAKPLFKTSDKEQESVGKHFKSAKDLYASMGYKNGAFTKNT